ncbi:MAG: hypothetical protein HY420_01560 [Candidatus Kerfeldbacteria bacterium]|nr:hypothetical protein [Candidatus Kerfeldbacteria bacterium]
MPREINLLLALATSIVAGVIWLVFLARAARYGFDGEFGDLDRGYRNSRFSVYVSMWTFVVGYAGLAFSASHPPLPFAPWLFVVMLSIIFYAWGAWTRDMIKPAVWKWKEKQRQARLLREKQLQAGVVR